MKIFRKSFIIVYCIIMGFFIVYYFYNKQASTIKTIRKSSEVSAVYETKITYFKTEKGWGYNIFLNGKKYIHQPTIPSLSGLNGFTTKEKAEKVAELVCQKIQDKIMPPSVNEEELKNLDIN